MTPPALWIHLFTNVHDEWNFLFQFQLSEEPGPWKEKLRKAAEEAQIGLENTKIRRKQLLRDARGLFEVNDSSDLYDWAGWNFILTWKFIKFYMPKKKVLQTNPCYGKWWIKLLDWDLETILSVIIFPSAPTYSTAIDSANHRSEIFENQMNCVWQNVFLSLFSIVLPQFLSQS